MVLAEDVMNVSGIVVTGSGEGRYFMSQEGYLAQIREKLGFLPYEGTLNIRVSGEDLKKIRLVKRMSGILINGFERGGKTFGDVIAYKAKIKGINCAVVMPKLSNYTDIVEIIAEKRIRDLLGLSDGSNMVLEIHINKMQMY